MPAQKSATHKGATKFLREAMESLHKAQGLHDEGNVDAARNEILKARSRFEAADSIAPNGAKAKIGAAVGVLDGLSGGLTKETKKLPEADQFLPQLPKPIAEAIKMGITQAVQALNPAEWLTEPDRVFQKWMDIHGLTTPNDVQKYFEEKVIIEHPENHPAHPQNQKNQKKTS